VVKGANWIDLV